RIRSPPPHPLRRLGDPPLRYFVRLAQQVACNPPQPDRHGTNEDAQETTSNPVGNRHPVTRPLPGASGAGSHASEIACRDRGALERRARHVLLVPHAVSDGVFRATGHCLSPVSPAFAHLSEPVRVTVRQICPL